MSEFFGVTDEMRIFVEVPALRTALADHIVLTAEQFPCLIEYSGDLVTLTFFLPREH